MCVHRPSVATHAKGQFGPPEAALPRTVALSRALPDAHTSRGGALLATGRGRAVKPAARADPGAEPAVFIAAETALGAHHRRANRLAEFAPEPNTELRGIRLRHDYNDKAEAQAGHHSNAKTRNDSGTEANAKTRNDSSTEANAQTRNDSGA